MKRLLAVAATVFCLSVAIPASAHHMAEGVVSDDIYAMIDENLVDSPHLLLDTTTIGSGSDTMVITTVEVMEEDVGEVLAIIGDALVGNTAWAGATGEGEMLSTRSTSLEFEVSDPTEDGLVTITIFEDVGQGESQPEPEEMP